MGRIVELVKIERSASGNIVAKQTDYPSFTKLCGCTATDLFKRTKYRKKLRGSPKAYLDWLDKKGGPFSRRIHRFLQEQASHFVAVLAPHLDLGKAAKTTDELIDELDFSGWDVLFPMLSDELQAAYLENAEQGLAMVGVDAGSNDMFNQVNRAAVKYASERAAELIGKTIDENGDLIDNPDPSYAITETTREELRDMVTLAIDEGLTRKELEEQLVNGWGFSEGRASTIARTELSFAHVQGNLEGWRTSGVVERKQSILGSEHDMDDVCDDAASLGPIPLEDTFPDGSDGPPFHPNCVCDLIAIGPESDNA